MRKRIVEDVDSVDSFGIPDKATVSEAATVDAARVAKKEATSLYKDLSEVTTNIIRALNALRDISAHRGKDMSLWRNQKGASSDQVKGWVDRLHQLGFLNADLDKGLEELMKIEREIRTFLGK